MKAPLAVLAFVLAVPAAGATTAADVAEAERMAREALATAHAAAAEALARRALARTAEFTPTAFVTAGRKGEVVEDAFVAARQSYRRHRALLYEAMGDSLARKGDARTAARFLRRAVLLEPTAGRVERLGAALLDSGQAGEAQHALLEHGHRGLAPQLYARAADLLGYPSAQLEIDRARLRALSPPVTVTAVPVSLPPGTRTTTGAPPAWDAQPTVLYVADATCRTCSRDLEALSRTVPKDVRVAMVPERPDEDHALRQVMDLYRHRWPMLIGRGVAAALPVEPGRVLVVARRGWAAAVVDPPFASLPVVVATLQRNDLREAVPRERWSKTPPAPPPPVAPPALGAEGLAPGDDMPAPEAWGRAVAAFREKRTADALRLFAQLEAEGWLLSPEARFDRALALGQAGRAAEARALLLAIGDSRFQDQVDRALETVGSRR